jgi:endoglucanase
VRALTGTGKLRRLSILSTVVGTSLVIATPLAVSALPARSAAPAAATGLADQLTAAATFDPGPLTTSAASRVVGAAVSAQPASAKAGTAARPATLTGAVAAAKVSAPSGWFHTSGARIVTASGSPVTLKAVNWFGLETANCAPHGLWTISLDQALDQMKSFGFNTIRLPFANQCLDQGAQPNGIDFSKNPGLRGLSPLQVMDKVVAGARARGLRVVLDRHRPDTGSQSELWYTSRYSEARWISDWTMLAKHYASDPTVIGGDLHNEPHGAACWGCGDSSRDWAAAATRAGNAILAVNPNWLIVVEGIERQGNGASTWWGGGLADVAKHPITLRVAHRVVYSPHDYPKSIYAQSWFSAPNYPANLPGVWNANWGYISARGIAPVWLGEFGTRYTDSSDVAWLRTMVSYLKSTGISFAYWSYNPNSGDTGGLVKDDWRTPETAKLQALAPILSGSAALPPATGSTPSTKPSTSPAPKPTTKPSTKPTTPTAPGAPSGSGSNSVQWTLSSAWNAGYVAQLQVSSSTAKDHWSVSWADPDATSVVNSWGMRCSVGGGRISCTGDAWAQALHPGQTWTVGLQVATTGPAPKAPALQS